MLIGILQCGHAPTDLRALEGDYEDMFAKLLDGNGFEFKTWNVVDMEFPEDALQADGWIFTGSRHGAYDDQPFIPPLQDLIREIYSSDRPMIGVCFGHQIIAHTLGGFVEKFKGGWVLGHQTYDVPGAGTMQLNAWHQDQVVKRPPDAEVLLTNEFCKNAGLVYGKKAMTIQPHPEFDKTAMEVFVNIKRGTADYPDDGIDKAESLIGAATHANKMAQDLADFLNGKYKA